VKTTQRRQILGGNGPVFSKIPNGITYAPLKSRVSFGKAVKRDEKRMRTLLRRVSTGLYFQGPDRWTGNPAEAHNFKLIDHALHFVEKWHLEDMELAFAFEDFGEVTRVPIDKMELKYSRGG
jgi:hypothetical protein